MNRTKAFLKNTASTAVLQIIAMLAGIITPRIMLVHYGSELNGLVSSISQFIAYFNIVEAGLSGAAIFALYKPLACNNIAAINSIVTATKKMYNKAGMFFLILVLGLAIVYPFYIHVNNMAYWDLFTLVFVLGGNGVLEFFTLAKYRALLTADQKIYIISLASMLQVILSTICIYILASYAVNIVILRAAVLVVIFIRTIIIVIYCHYHYRQINYHAVPDMKALNKHWAVLYLQILGIIQQGTPIVLLTIFVRDLKIVSVYVIYNMVLSGVNGILSIFVNSLPSAFGEVIAKDEKDNLKKIYSEFEFVYYNFIGMIYLIAFMTIQPFIIIYTRNITDINYNVPLIGFLFVLNGLLYNLKTPQGMMVGSAGLYRETRWQTTIQGGIALFIGVILVMPYHIVGVLIGLIASNLYRDIDLVFFIPKYVTHIDPWDSVHRIFRILVITGIVLGISSAFSWTVSNYWEWAIMTIVISIGCAGVFTVNAFVSEHEQFSKILIRIKRLC